MYGPGFNSEDEDYQRSKAVKISLLRQLAEQRPELKAYVEEYVRYWDEFDQAYYDLAGTGLSDGAIVAEMVQLGFTTCPCGNAVCPVGNLFKTELYRINHPGRELPEGIDLLHLVASELEYKLQPHPENHPVVHGLGPNYFECTECGILENDTRQMREKIQVDLERTLDEISLVEEASLYAWIVARFRDFPSKADAINWLKSITVEWHDTTIHGKFVEDPNRPGVCKECDWINPEFESNPRLKITLRQRALEFLKALETPPIIVVDAVLVETPSQPFYGFSLN